LDTPLLERSMWDGHREYRCYRPPDVQSLLDGIARAWLADCFVCLGKPFTIRALPQTLFNVERAYQRNRVRTTFAREVECDFGPGRAGTPRNPDANGAQPAHTPHWKTMTTDIRDINVMVRRLQARGGNVVFLRAPSSGARWSREDQLAPRRENWDRFARLTNAVCLHFQELPGARPALSGRIPSCV
jgi:hypothetical protein